MKTEEFNKLLEERIEKTKLILANKANEYASGGDRLYNFKEAARKLNITPEKALQGIKIKHDVSVDDLIQWAEGSPEKLTEEIINEKIGDSINYLILLEALLKERLLNEVKKKAFLSNSFFERNK